MGNCSSATVKEVTDHLEEQLRVSAMLKLHSDFGDSLPGGSSLQDYATALSKDNFKKLFGYDWAETQGNVHPPNISKTTPRAFPATDYCIVPANKNLEEAVNKYVSDGLANVTLEDWIKDKVTSDLAATIRKYLTYPCDNEWHSGSSSATYDAANPDVESYQLDLSLIYSAATRTESAVEATVHIIYFVGVYYTIDSPKTAAYSNLRTESYTSAVQLANIPTPINDNLALTAALQQYGDKIFNDQWHYDYNTGKPSDAAKDESDPILTRNAHLSYFPTRNVPDDQIDSYVQLNIINGFHIPKGNWESLIKADILSAFNVLVRNPDSDTWNHEAIDKQYGVGEASKRPLNLNGFLIYWSKSHTISVNSQDVKIEVAYIYFFGIIYETAEDPILQDMKHVICNNIPNVDTSTIPARIGPDDLQKLVEVYNIAQFKAKFDIDFPTDGRSDSKNKYWRTFFEFNTETPTQSDISTKVENQIFGSDATVDEQIKHNLQGSVYNLLVKLFTDYSGPTYAKDPNEWYNQTKESNMPYKGKDNSDWLLEVRTSWAYVYGTMTEDLHGGETTNYFHLSLLLHVRAIQDDDSDSDV